MFENLIEVLKANPRKIVYTEGTDARILKLRIKKSSMQLLLKKLLPIRADLTLKVSKFWILPPIPEWTRW